MSEVTRPELPTSGYSLVKVYAPHLELSHAKPNSSGSQAALNFGFEWRKVSDDHLDVMLRVKIDPSGERPERLEVHIVGHFKRIGEPVLSMEQFATVQAVAILFPYVRQHLTAVTMSSFFGPYYLPTLNVGVLMKGHRPTRVDRVSAVTDVSSRRKILASRAAAKKR